MEAKNEIFNSLSLGLKEEGFNWKKALTFIESVESLAKKKAVNLDDVIFEFFVNGNEKKINGWLNKKLLATMLMKLVWVRLNRRSVTWHEGSELLMPKYNSISKLEVVAGRCRNALMNNDDGFYEAVLSLILFAKGDYSEAFKLSSKVRLKGYPYGSIYRSFFSGINNFYYEDYYPMASFDSSSSGFNLDYDALIEIVSDELVNVVSCDKVYFDKFSNDFLRSARSSGYNDPIVFFVLGENVGYRVLGEKSYVFYVSTEYELQPALYASFRYLISRFIINYADSGVFVFDIDFIFNSKISKDLYTIVATADIGLTIHSYGVRSVTPWTKVSAPLSFFSKSKASILFLSNYVGYWEEAWRKSEFRWWIDQNALFSSYQYIQRCFPSVKIENVFDIANSGVTNNQKGVLEFKNEFRGK